MDTNKPLAGGVPMVAINGAAIRRIREEKGLTQLYVATVVGVTTDTISRWENRRYPNIKKENALKLAEALESGLAEILEPSAHSEDALPADIPPPSPDNPEPETIAAPGLQEPGSPESPLPPESPPKHGSKTAPKSLILAGSIFVLILAAIALFRWWQGLTEEGKVRALRIMPTHAAPGAAFPVIIQVESEDEQPLSLIIKETLPPACQVIQTVPQASSQVGDPPVLKWIAKANGKQMYAYMAKLKADTAFGSRHFLNGGITRRSGSKSVTVVEGWNELLASPHHWADENRDGRIDDEELLAMYELFDVAEKLNFSRDRIEKIWAADGYRWNPEARDYLIVPRVP